MTLREISNSKWNQYFLLPNTKQGASEKIEVQPKRSPEREHFFGENFVPTTIKPTIKSELANSSVLRRFVDLPKFIDLIVNRRLVLPTIKKLQEGDPHECEAEPDYTNVPIDELKQRILLLREYIEERDLPFDQKGIVDIFEVSSFVDLKQLLDGMTDDQIRRAAWCVEHRRLQNEICCNCWYGSKLESDAMWRLYCDRVGVAVTTTVERLRDSIQCKVPKMFKDDFYLTLASVEYNDAPVTARTPSWLLKRSAYSHESEIRLFVDTPDAHGPGFVLETDPSILIENLTVSPYAMGWQAEAIKALTFKILGSQVRFIPSKHRDAKPPAWPQKMDLKALQSALRRDA